MVYQPSLLIFLIRPFKFPRGLRCYSLRHTNLGEITEYLLEDGVPNLLQRSFKDSYLDDQIRLRFLPTTHPYFPVLQGKIKYKASLNAIRLISNKLILKKNCQLHVTSAITLLKDEEESAIKANQYNCLTSNDKLIVKWQSCSPNEMFNHNGSRIKVTSIPKNLSNDSTPPIIDYILRPSGKSISGEMITNDNSFVPQKNDLSRVAKGMFIFEFNDDNSKISVHTFEDVGMIDFDKNIETGALAC